MNTGSESLGPESGLSAAAREWRWWDVAWAMQRDGDTDGDEGWVDTLHAWIDRARELWSRETRLKWRIHALNALFFSELGLKSVSAKRNPSCIYLRTVVDQREGNCLSLSLLYLVVAESIGIPLVPVLASKHVFVRYDDGTSRQNIETTRRGRRIPNGLYGESASGMEQPTRWLDLMPRQFLALMFLSRATYVHVPLKRWTLAMQDLETAESLFPDCAYVHFNRALIQRAMAGNGGPRPHAGITLRGNIRTESNPAKHRTRSRPRGVGRPSAKGQRNRVVPIRLGSVW